MSPFASGFDPVAAARDPLAWPAALALIDSAEGAFAFVQAAEAEFPGLVAGIGAPVLDPLLRTAGFVALWRQAAASERDSDRELHRHLGFRLTWLGLLDGLDVDQQTAERVATDLVQLGAGELASARGKALLNAAERAYGRRWQPAIAAAIRDASNVPASLVRRVLGEPGERDAGDRAALALASDDVAVVLQGHDDPEVIAPLVERATAASAHVRLEVFLLAARRGVQASLELLRGSVILCDEYPENRSARVVRGLALLAEDERTKLLLAEPRLPWMYVDGSADARVIAAAVATLEAATALEEPWVIRAFHTWGQAGRFALEGSTSAKARMVEDVLVDFAARRSSARRPHDLADLRTSLRGAIESALDALDRDPAAAPSRSLIHPVLAFGRAENAANPGGFIEGWSSSSVEAYSRLPGSSLVALLRRFTTTVVTEPSPEASDPRWARLLRTLEQTAKASLPTDSQDDPPTTALAILTRDEADPVRRVRFARDFWQTFLLETIPEVARVSRIQDARTYVLDQTVAGVEGLFRAVKIALPLDPPLPGERDWEALADSLWSGLDALGEVDVRIVWQNARASMPIESDFDLAVNVMLDVARSLSEPGSGRTVAFEVT